MAEAISIEAPPRSRSFGFPAQLLRLLPGLALLAAIGYGGKLIERTINAYGKAHHLALPNIEQRGARQQLPGQRLTNAWSSHRYRCGLRGRSSKRT